MHRRGWKGARDEGLESAQLSLPTADTTVPNLFGLHRKERNETNLEPSATFSLEDASIMTSRTDPGVAVTSGRVDFGRATY